MGEIGTLNVKTLVNTRIAAFRHDSDGSGHICIYCQGEHCLSLRRCQFIETLAGVGYRAITELGQDSHWDWGRRTRLPDALDGTSIAGVAYPDGARGKYHVYYQTEDLSLREHCLTRGGEWHSGLSLWDTLRLT